MNNILHNSTLEPSLATIYTKGNIELSPNDIFSDSFFQSNILSIRKSEYPLLPVLKNDYPSSVQENLKAVTHLFPTLPLLCALI